MTTESKTEEKQVETVTITQQTLEDMYVRAALLSDEDLDKLEQRIQAIRDIRGFRRAFEMLREGLTEEQLDMIEAAIDGDVSKYEQAHP